MLTIIVPIKYPKRAILEEFFRANIPSFKAHKLIVIDSGGGELFNGVADCYINKKVKLPEARKIGYSFVETKYIMNLDCDVVIPRGYIEKALEIMEANAKIAAVSIFYEDVTHNGGILEYGISIWQTEFLKENYDYNPKQISPETIKVGEGKYITAGYPYCECMHMWRRVLEKDLKIETLPIRAKHLNRKV